MVSDSSSRVRDQNKLQHQSANLCDSSALTSLPRASSKNSAANGSAPLDDECFENGTTQSLSRPDSALLGNHQFQATALKENAVGSVSDSSSRISNHLNVCSRIVTDSHLPNTKERMYSDFSNVKITVNSEQFPVMSFVDHGASNNNKTQFTRNDNHPIFGFSADCSIGSDENPSNEFADATGLSVSSDDWNPNDIGRRQTSTNERRPSAPIRRPLRSCRKKTIIIVNSSSGVSSSGDSSSDDSSSDDEFCNTQSSSKVSASRMSSNITDRDKNKSPIDLCSDESSIENINPCLLESTDEEVQISLSSKPVPSKPSSSDAARVIENIVRNHYENQNVTTERSVLARTVKWSTQLCSLALRMLPSMFGKLKRNYFFQNHLSSSNI